MKLLKHISFILLAALYLTTACAYTVTVLASGIPASGSDTVCTHNGNTKEIPAKLSIQRRHMPLANEIQLPSTHIVEAQYPPICDEQSLIVCLSTPGHKKAYYYSTFGDRAPPIA